jgi:hypothetical protein
MLTRLLDSGVVGVVFYVLMLMSLLVAASFLIRSRHERWAPYALAVAAATVAFLVLSFLFDVMAFPHTPYALVSLAALLAIMRTAFADETGPEVHEAPAVERFVRGAPGEPASAPVPALTVAGLRDEDTGLAGR